jgi:hypothetical protein
MPHPTQTHCNRGHAYAEHGTKNNRGAHICRLCIRHRSRHQEGARKRMREMGRMLRDGLALSIGEHEALQAWQRKVWTFFDKLETLADSKRDGRRKVAA